MNTLDQEQIKDYYQKNVLTSIDPSLYKVNYNCFACYYRQFLLNDKTNDCLFGDHPIVQEKWYSCHLLPITNPNGKLLKLYDIVNNDTKLFLSIYKNQELKYTQFIELINYIMNLKTKKFKIRMHELEYLKVQTTYDYNFIKKQKKKLNTEFKRVYRLISKKE